MTRLEFRVAPGTLAIPRASAGFSRQAADGSAVEEVLGECGPGSPGGRQPWCES